LDRKRRRTATDSRNLHDVGVEAEKGKKTRKRETVVKAETATGQCHSLFKKSQGDFRRDRSYDHRDKIPGFQAEKKSMKSRPKKRSPGSCWGGSFFWKTQGKQQVGRENERATKKKNEMGVAARK